MDDRYRRNVPDPSATIPDFGPRPNVKVAKKKAEVSRTPDGDVAVGQQAAPPAASGANPLVLALVGLLVAIIAGMLGFFVVVFAGMAFYLLMA